MIVKYGCIMSGYYSTEETELSDFLIEIELESYEMSCINRSKKLYVLYRPEHYTPADMKDWMYVVKLDDNNKIITLTEDDIEFVAKYHYFIFQVYCWHTCETIMALIKCNIDPDFSKLQNEDKNVQEIELGYQNIFNKWKKNN